MTAGMQIANRLSRNKMANRFEESNSILIESLKETAKKLNKAQTHWLRVWSSWTAQ